MIYIYIYIYICREREGGKKRVRRVMVTIVRNEDGDPISSLGGC